MTIEFTSVLTQADGMKATGIPIPDSVVAELGGAKNASLDIRVRKTGDSSDWYEYRTSIGNRVDTSCRSARITGRRPVLSQMTRST